MTAKDNSQQSVVCSDPAHEDLYREVGLVRTKGVADLPALVSEVPLLGEIADVIGAGAEAAERIEDALRKSVQRLGGMGTPALEALFGLDPATRGLGVAGRRTAAAEIYDYKAYEVFRTGHEPSLLMFVATYLRVLVDEQRLDERERAFAKRELYLQHLLDLDYYASTHRIDTKQPSSNGPESDLSSVQDIYHLDIHGETKLGFVYSKSGTRTFVHVVDMSCLEQNKLRRWLHIPHRRYQLTLKNGGALDYWPPIWLIRVYRSVVIRFWQKA